MKKLLSLLLVTVMVLSLALAGCSNSNEETTTKAPEQTTKAPGGETTTKAPEVPAEPTEFRFAYEVEPQAMDHHRYFIPIIRMVALAVYEPLIREYNGEIVPAAAESWTVSDDGLVYTFKLREGMTWTDGVPLTAQHYVDGVKRLASPELASSMGGTYSAMFVNGPKYNSGECSFDEVGVKALDELTVQYTLSYPLAYFMDQLKNAAYLPIRLDIADPMGQEYGNTNEGLVYCGPYVLTEWIRESEMTLVKNENHWAADTIAQIDTVHIDIIPNGDTRALMFDNGDVDFTMLATAQVEVYKDSPYYQYFNAGNNYGYIFNTHDKQLQNQNLRKALAYAPDRAGMCTGMFFNAYTPSYRIVPDGTLAAGSINYTEFTKGVKGWDQTTNAQIANDALNLALTELNLTKDQIDLEIMTGDTDSVRLTAEASVDAFEQVLGLDVSAQLYPSQQRWDNEVNGRYQIDITGYSVASNDAYEYLKGYITGGNYLHSGIQNHPSYAEYEGKLNAAKTEVDPEKYATLLGEAEQIFMDTYIHTPLYHGNRIYLLRTDAFEGMEMNRSGMEMNWIFATAK